MSDAIGQRKKWCRSTLVGFIFSLTLPTLLVAEFVAGAQRIRPQDHLADALVYARFVAAFFVILSVVLCFTGGLSCVIHKGHLKGVWLSVSGSVIAGGGGAWLLSEVFARVNYSFLCGPVRPLALMWPIVLLRGIVMMGGPVPALVVLISYRRATDKARGPGSPAATAE